MKTIDEQIKCVDRELAMRKAVYPRRVEIGKMKQAESDHQIETMQAVLATLLEVKKQPKLL